MKIVFKIDSAVSFGEAEMNCGDDDITITFPDDNSEYKYAMLTNDANEESLKSPFLFCSKDCKEWTLAVKVSKGDRYFGVNRFGVMTITELFNEFG